MNKILALISLFIMSIISIFYWTFKPKGTLYEAKWNAPDTTIAITINGEISTTFPTTPAYTGTVECTSGTGKIEWKKTKWVLTTNNITNGNIKCNALFIARDLTLSEMILLKNEIETPLTVPGKEVSSKNEAILASTEDDYGTSYYFRGAVKNNYVEFANKCWRIVRITGDGSIKIILHNDNTTGVSSPCSSANNSSSAAFAKYNDTDYTTSFNPNSVDNAYLGFMYGTTGASDYTSAHANTNKSTILTNLETWYINNLTSYSDKLADTIWCNDKSTSDSGYYVFESYYGAYDRINTNPNPSLICPADKNNGNLSKLTVKDKINGNGALSYKIGLLTVDEMAFAGCIYRTSNANVYLQENASSNNWWIMTPDRYKNHAYIWMASTDSALLTYAAYYSYGLRPAISLTSSVTASGTGTSEDPYIVK